MTEYARTSSRSRRRGAASLSLVFAVAVCGLLLASGVYYQAASRTETQVGPSTPLRKPFDDFPREFLDYKWTPERLDPQIERTAGAEAYLKQTGIHPGDTAWVDLYASYVGRGESLVEHEPQVCYASVGFSLPFGIIQTELDMPPTPAHGDKPWKLPVNVYFFERDVTRIMVVNYYCGSWDYSNDRMTIRLKPNVPGSFYLQTRVSLPLGDADALNFRENYKTNPRFLQAVEILRYAAPRLEEYLPLKSDN